MSETRKITVTVNGTRYEETVPVRVTLADFIRHQLGLTGTHLGCEHGVCGACTVAVDGQPVRSCLMLAMQAEGRIEHIGLSNVTLDQLRRAHARGPVASVSNAFSYGNQKDTPTLEFCTQNGIPYLPFWPLGRGAIEAPPAEPGHTAAQAGLAWLLARSPFTVLIAGTSSVRHLEENIAAPYVNR